MKKIKSFSIISLFVLLCGCTPVKENSTSYLDELSNVTAEVRINSSDTESLKESVSADVSVDLEDNPGITIDEAFEYNGTAYYMDMPVTRFITDSDNNIIEPPLSDDSDIVRHLYSLDEYEHIGNGGDFGVISGCELYFIEDGLILAVFPYGDHLNGDADKNDILSLYNENNIYGARFYLGSKQKV